MGRMTNTGPQPFLLGDLWHNEIVGLFLAAFWGNSVSERTLFGIKTTKKGEHMQKSAAESR